MAKTANQKKQAALKGRGALNPEPDSVNDELFIEHHFFDPCDSVQVKYEMLRRVHVDEKSVSSAAQSFGFSRPSFYQAQQRFFEGGLPALVPKKPGPRNAHKLGDEVMKFLEETLEKNRTLRSSALVELIEEHFGVSVHRRSVERALERRKKNVNDIIIITEDRGSRFDIAV